VPNLPTSLGEVDAGDVTEKPPPREWLLGNIFARTFMSSLLADGGVGKTALRLAQLMSLAIGRSLTGEYVFQRCRVLIISLEDDIKELERRILALRLHYGIDLSELKGWLFYAAPGGTRGKLMTSDKKGNTTLGPLAGTIEATVVARNIDIVSIDPFVKSHAVEENNNNGIDEVVQVLTDLATKHNIAIDAPHHTSKGTSDPGNANRGRGASSMKDAARLVYTLAVMSTEEAKAFGIKEEQRRLYIRMDSGKVNIAPARVAKWFKLVGVPLNNGNDLYPNGDEVQAVEPWTPPETWTGLDTGLLNQVLTVIDAGLPDGTRYTNGPKAGERAAWKVVVEHAPDKSEVQAREVIKTWIKNGVLTVEDYDNPVTRKPAKGLHLDTTKRPG
jgi:AAA domain